MKAVATARPWWAVLRPRSPAQAAAPPTALGARVASVSAASLLLLATAIIGFAAIGCAVTQYNDQRFAGERHEALAHALEEFHAVFGNVDHFDYGQLGMLERRSGLKDLRFDSDPVPQSAREMQSLANAQGRIVGWFSWVPDRGLIAAMDWLWGLAGAVGVALVLFAIVLRRATRRLARSLAGSIETTRKLTSEDPLTGLPNQRVMLEALDRALLERGHGHVALALIDLDGFREINETVGRKRGDEVFLAVAERLRAGVPEGTLLGRFTDDEFAVIASGEKAGAVAKLGEALHELFADPITIDQSWQITAGIGLAQAPEDGASGEELARRAGMALRAAKRAGRGMLRRFEPRIEAESADRRFLIRELKAAVAQQSFDVHYQPIVAADGSGIVGVEALLRWTHAQRGAIAPSVFIPLAEQNGLMGKLGEIVLRRALGDAMRWPDVFVAVNLSPLQIRDPPLVDLVRSLLAEARIEPSRVVLEMTEGILIDDPDETQRRLEALRALGVELALDDFGTGYSSLGYLQKFPFQRLKIDRTFVASLGSLGNAGAIIQSIVTLGHALGMSVLAEGIETDEQRVLLRLAGCDELQGFLFARPAPAAAIDALLSPPPAARGPDRTAAAAG